MCNDCNIRRETMNFNKSNHEKKVKKLNMLIYRNNKKRCMKKLFVVLAILFVGILLAGCTSQPAAPVATSSRTPTMAFSASG